jgi:hypothetical protein
MRRKIFKKLATNNNISVFLTMNFKHIAKPINSQRPMKIYRTLFSLVTQKQFVLKLVAALT